MSTALGAINSTTSMDSAAEVDSKMQANGNRRLIEVRILEKTTDHTVSTGVGGDFEIPFTGTINNVFAYVDTAGTTGLATIDFNKNGTTVLSTKVTIDSTEKSSRTAATPPVISVSGFTKGDLYTFDIDVIQTTAAKGLTVVLDVTITSF